MRVLSKKMLPATIGLVLGASLAAPASAAPGWYAGLGIGRSSIDNLDPSAEGGFASIDGSVDSLSTDDAAIGWKAFAGYGFNDYFAVEGFYADFGAYDVGFDGSIDVGESSVPISGDLGADASGFGVFGVLGIPLGNFQVFGKIGGIHWNADASIASFVDGEPVSASMGDDGNDFAWGAGLKYQLTDHLGVALQFEQFTTIEDIDFVSWDVRWAF